MCYGRDRCTERKPRSFFLLIKDMPYCKIGSCLIGVCSSLGITWSTSYLVDPASSHMLVSKTKPCMSKFKRFKRWDCGRLIISVIVYLMVDYYKDNRRNSRANTCTSRWFNHHLHLLDLPPMLFGASVIHSNLADPQPFGATLHSNFCPISFRW